MNICRWLVLVVGVLGAGAAIKVFGTVPHETYEHLAEFDFWRGVVPAASILGGTLFAFAVLTALQHIRQEIRVD